MISLKKSYSGHQWNRCYEVFQDIGVWYYSGNKLKYGGWYPFLSYVKNIHILAEFMMELVALAVKSGWVDGDRYIFMSMFFADGLGFGATL